MTEPLTEKERRERAIEKASEAVRSGNPFLERAGESPAITHKEQYLAKRIDNWLERRLGGLIPLRRSWLSGSSWKPAETVEWRWFNRPWLIIRRWRPYGK